MTPTSPIEGYMMALRSCLPLTSSARRFCSEVEEHLRDSASRFEREGSSPARAAQLAIESFGSPEQISQAFTEEGGALMSGQMSRRSMTIGVVLIAPSLLFVLANILKFNLDAGYLYDGIFGPLFRTSGLVEGIVTSLVILGPLACLFIAVVTNVHLELRRGSGVVRANVALRKSTPGVALSLISVLVLVALGAYLITENLGCLFERTYC